MPDAVAFGERLRALRLAAGMSPLELALAAGVRESDISRWERNPEMDVRLSSLRKIAAAFGVSLDSMAGSPATGPEQAAERFRALLDVMTPDQIIGAMGADALSLREVEELHQRITESIERIKSRIRPGVTVEPVGDGDAPPTDRQAALAAEAAKRTRSTKPAPATQPRRPAK
ncbi:MAG: helix-turn-helix transcriptional regulator [Actinobacteria bacterium]|nr:helix-turn-helix transcriptional regulator [Actinomycetota bacterium]